MLPVGRFASHAFKLDDDNNVDDLYLYHCHCIVPRKRVFCYVQVMLFSLNRWRRYKNASGWQTLCVCVCVLCVCLPCLWLCVSSGLNNSHPPIGTHSIIASAFAFRQHFMARLVSVVRDLIAPACLLRHITHANPLPSYAHPYTYMHKSIVCLFTYLISLSIYVLLEAY